MKKMAVLPQRWVWGGTGLLAGLVGVLAGILTACTLHEPPPLAPEPEIHIGVLAPLSGELAESGGFPLVNGASLAVQQVNDQGGLVVQGRSYRVVLHIEDDHDTPQIAVEAARKLIVQDRVVALVGPRSAGLPSPWRRWPKARASP
ncbi:MAG: ABC transporter substrate-binding protein [Chloroflexaceae bacterium]|nr:ABC transporter substrate-binding protein [Chloroflexaceae bacterium]